MHTYYFLSFVSFVSFRCETVFIFGIFHDLIKKHAEKSKITNFRDKRISHCTFFSKIFCVFFSMVSCLSQLKEFRIQQKKTPKLSLHFPLVFQTIFLPWFFSFLPHNANAGSIQRVCCWLRYCLNCDRADHCGHYGNFMIKTKIIITLLTGLDCRVYLIDCTTTIFHFDCELHRFFFFILNSFHPE